MSDSTVYDIKMQYLLSDQASPGLKSIANNASLADRATIGLKSTIAALGIGFGLHSIFGKGKEMLVGFNNEMEQLRISSAAMLAENGIAKTFEQAIPKAQQLVKEFQKFSITSPLTTKQLAEFEQGVNSAIGSAGGSLRDLAKITEYGALYGKTHGIEQSQVALQLSEGIRGNVTSRNRTMMGLLAGGGLTREEFKAYDIQKRMDVIQKLLMSKSAMDAAKAYEHSFIGELSSLQDIFQLTLGRVGEPLFKAITAQLKEWNGWFRNNKAYVDQLADTVGQKLVSAFNAVKDAFAWIYDHREGLILVAETFAAMRLGGAAANMFELQAAKAGYATAGASIANGFAGAVAGLGIGIIIGKGLTGYLEEHFDFFKKLKHNADAYKMMNQRDEQVAKMAPDMIMGGDYASRLGSRFGDSVMGLNQGQTKALQAQLLGLLGSQSGVNSLADQVRLSNSFTSGRNGLGSLDRSSFAAYQRAQGTDPRDIEQMFLAAQKVLVTSNALGNSDLIFGQKKGITQDPDALDSKRRRPTPDSYNITVQRVEVATDDPDAFAMALTTMADRALASRTQPRGGLMGNR